jgi:PAS domain S-box-containing protein
MRSLVVLVVVLSAAAAALLLGQSLRSRVQLRDQVLEQVQRFSLNLSDAMAGQVQGLFSSIDLALMQVRREWPEKGRSAVFESDMRETLASLPAGLVSHVVMANAQGDVVFNSLGVSGAVNIADRDYFKGHLGGGDRLLIGVPVRSRLDGRWVFAISRPLLREGRFEGTVHFTLSTEALSENLARLSLSAQDVVALVHADGNVLARSVDNPSAMGQKVPADRPFMANPALGKGVYHVPGLVDQVSRTFGWHRLPNSGVVLVVGIADASVLDPLAPSIRRNQWSASIISLLLLSGGGLVAFLLWRVAKSQAAAGLSEARLKEAQQLAHVGDWTYDVAQDRLSWSDEMYRIFGLDLKRKNISLQGFMDRVHPEDLGETMQKFQDVTAPDQRHEATHRIVLPDGSVKHVRELWINEVVDGKLVHYRGTVQDVEEMHAVQQALRQLNEKLEQRVEARTRALGEANQELETFAYSVSHDLRTPLRSIHGFATLLEEECKDLPGEGPVFLKRIQDAAARMGTLITDLLSMAHHSRALVQHQRVDLSGLARDIVEELEGSDPERRVRWVIEEGLSAMADPILMRAVLQNLLANAWKYARHADPAHIRFSRSRHADGVQEFCVRDNGAGFDMAFVEQLFQPFKRLHTNQQFEGSGVGLATVLRVVQRHGGSVRGEGVVGQGAAFFFSLPDTPAVHDVAED